jgi:hypothetical protein
MKLRTPVVVFLFVVGAVAGLIGDHCHVVTATIEYLPRSHRVPFVWSSPIWFPVLVGTGTVLLAELRLHLGAARTTASMGQGLGGIAAVLGIYAITALMHAAPADATTVLICALAAITWCVLGDRFAVVPAIGAAIVGTALEVILSAVGVFRYTHGSDGLLSVAPWLPPLYVAFAVAAALLGEIAATDQQHTSDT